MIILKVWLDPIAWFRIDFSIIIHFISSFIFLYTEQEFWKGGQWSQVRFDPSEE